MTSLIVDSNNYDNELSKYKEKYTNIRILESTFTGLEESYPIAFRVPDGIFYANVTESRLSDVISGHADDLIVQSARIFSVEMKKFVSEPIYRRYVKDFLEIVEDLQDFSSPFVTFEINQFVTKFNIAEDELINPMKMALIKTTIGPSLPILMDALGKKECIVRLKDYLYNYRYRM
jgi:glutamyl/glutaminyl-tRNA synthetase